MEDNFKLEIISPEKIIFSDDAKMVTIPSYEGDMSILKNHISLVTFLRPGLIEILDNKNNEKFFVEEGTVEFSSENLLILSPTVINIKNLSKEKISLMISDAEKEIKNSIIKDKEKYILSHKLDTLKEIRQ